MQELAMGFVFWRVLRGWVGRDRVFGGLRGADGFDVGFV